MAGCRKERVRNERSHTRLAARSASSAFSDEHINDLADGRDFEHFLRFQMYADDFFDVVEQVENRK